MNDQVKYLDDWSVCFQTRYGQPHKKHWYAFDPTLVPGMKEGDGYLCDGLKRRAERYPAAPVPEAKWGVHETHCCRRHGCQYKSYERCPVVAGAIDADGSCEMCTEPAEMAKDLVETIAGSTYPDDLNVGELGVWVDRAREIKKLMEAHDDY